MPSRLCGAPTLGGGTCKLRTTTTFPCCWIHSRVGSRTESRCAGARIHRPGPDKVSLRVKPSRIAAAGRGLFVDAKKSGRKAVFQAGNRIARYTGKILTQKQLDRRYPGDELAPYAVSAGRVNGKRVYIDGRSWKSSVARYANDGCGAKYGASRIVNGVATHCARTNAFLKSVKGKVWLVALKDLRDGDEIYAEYGEGYWRGGSKAKAPAVKPKAAKPPKRPKASEFVKRLAQRRGYANEREVLLSVRGKKHVQQIVPARSNAKWVVTKDAGTAATLVPHATLLKERATVRKHLASALRTLHKAGWRHHDLYPRNVTRAEQGGKPVYSLIDYDKMKPAQKTSNVEGDLEVLLARLKLAAR
jgi:tRNA A-37 threonylcarbamoyl transferase component Bud32